MPFHVSFSTHLECSLNVQTKENKQNISILFSTTFCFVFPGEMCIEYPFTIWKKREREWWVQGRNGSSNFVNIRKYHPSVYIYTYN